MPKNAKNSVFFEIKGPPKTPLFDFFRRNFDIFHRFWLWRTFSKCFQKKLKIFEKIDFLDPMDRPQKNQFFQKFSTFSKKHLENVRHSQKRWKMSKFRRKKSNKGVFGGPLISKKRYFKAFFTTEKLLRLFCITEKIFSVQIKVVSYDMYDNLQQRDF